MGVVASSALIAGINVSAVNVALGDIAHDLGATTSGLQWIVNAYGLAYAVLLVSAAALGDHIGHDRLFRIGLAAGAGSAVIAASAGNTELVIVGRIAAGIAAAAMTPSGLSIINVMSSSPLERARAIGLWTGFGSLGVAAGPVVGGVLLERFWWGSVFLVNVPVLLVLLLIARLTVRVPRAGTERPVDVVGSVALTATLVALVWPLIEAPQRGWTSGLVLGSAGAFIILARLTVVWFVRTGHPVARLDRVGRRGVVVPAVAAGASVFVLGGVMLAFAILLRVVHGYTPMATGLALSPIAISMTVAATMSARLSERIGAHRTLGLGLALGGLFCGLLALLAGAHVGPILAASTALGIGHGLCSAPSTSLVVGAFAHDDAGTASGVSVACRQIFMLLGVAVMGSVLSMTYQRSLDDRLSSFELSAAAREASLRSVSGATEVARGLPDSRGGEMARLVTSSFEFGLRVMALVALVVVASGMLVLSRGRRAARLPPGDIVPTAPRCEVTVP